MTERIIMPNAPSSAHGDVLFIHGDTVNRTTAFDGVDGSAARFYIPRILGALQVKIHVFSEDHQEIFVKTGEYVDSEKEYDIFETGLNDLSCGLYFLCPTVITHEKEYYGYKKNNGVSFQTDRCESNIQISVCDFHGCEVPTVYGGFIYHIFVDRFYKYGRSRLHGDSILNEDWENGMVQFPEVRGGPLKNNMFFGGTLDGIRKKLPFLSSLGVTILYLSPIFESPSNHKYDTGDYAKIDEMFGGDDAFTDLVAAAQQYHIGIILDGVFNHTGADSKYFNRYGHYDTVGAYQSEKSPYYSWYDFQDFPNRYTCWWDIPILPRINPDVPSCRSYFTGKGGIVEKYAKSGILGFRLDVVDELSDDFVEDIKSTLKNTKKETFLIGEVWEDASNKIAYGKRKRYYLGKELDSVMNYPLRSGIISYFLYGDTEKLSYALTDIFNNAPRRIKDAEMNFLGTHDTERILTVFADHDIKGLSNADLATEKCTSEEEKTAKKRLLAAYTVLFTLPGIPSVFYGDEAGLQGYHDPFNRMPYPWDRMDKTILCHFKKLGKLRKTEKVYQKGDFHILALDTDQLIFDRTDDCFAYITIVNRSKSRMKVEFSGVALNLLSNKEGNKFNLLPTTTAVFKMHRKEFFMIEKSK